MTKPKCGPNITIKKRKQKIVIDNIFIVMKHTLCLLFSVVIAFGLAAQQKTENVVIVTLDGMRWQEVFEGADEALMNDSVYNHDKDGIRKKFWDRDEEERRKK